MAGVALSVVAISSSLSGLRIPILILSANNSRVRDGLIAINCLSSLVLGPLISCLILWPIQSFTAINFSGSIMLLTIVLSGTSNFHLAARSLAIKHGGLKAFTRASRLRSVIQGLLLFSGTYIFDLNATAILIGYLASITIGFNQVVKTWSMMREGQFSTIVAVFKRHKENIKTLSAANLFTRFGSELLMLFSPVIMGSSFAGHYFFARRVSAGFISPVFENIRNVYIARLSGNSMVFQATQLTKFFKHTVVATAILVSCVLIFYYWIMPRVLLIGYNTIGSLELGPLLMLILVLCFSSITNGWLQAISSSNFAHGTYRKVLRNQVCIFILKCLGLCLAYFWSLEGLQALVVVLLFGALGYLWIVFDIFLRLHIAMSSRIYWILFFILNFLPWWIFFHETIQLSQH